MTLSLRSIRFSYSKVPTCNKCNTRQENTYFSRKERNYYQRKSFWLSQMSLPVPETTGMKVERHLLLSCHLCWFSSCSRYAQHHLCIIFRGFPRPREAPWTCFEDPHYEQLGDHHWEWRNLIFHKYFLIPNFYFILAFNKHTQLIRFPH